VSRLLGRKENCEVGDVVGLPNSDYVAILVDRDAGFTWVAQPYRRSTGWTATETTIAVDTMDMFGAPHDVPDHIYAEAMKLRLLT